MKYCIGLLACLLTLSAQAQKPQLRKPATRPAATTQSTSTIAAIAPVLVVKRTPCHGTCPVYTAAIFADGRVEYDGERYVALLGKHTLSLPVATVNQLLAEAKRINFTNFQDQYAGNNTDLSATIITVHPTGQPAKTVHAQENLPASLESYVNFLAQRLDKLANNSLSLDK